MHHLARTDHSDTCTTIIHLRMYIHMYTDIIPDKVQ